MNSKVTIVADSATGMVINQSVNNPEYGYVKLQQSRTIIDDNGFLKKTTLNALIKAPIDILKEMNYYPGQILDGKIIVKESMTPFNKKSPERDIKIAGNTGIACTLEGNPIYRKIVYTQSANAEDITIQHDNIEELREANSYKVNSSAMRPSEDFSL